MVVNNTGVGIGTQTPTSKLHVAGDVLATGSFIVGSGSAANPSFEFVGDTDTGMFAPAANTIALATSGVERLRINNVGNVGIGTTGPTTTLQVNGSFSCGYGGDPNVGGQGLYVDALAPSLIFNDSSGPNTTVTIDNNGLTLHDFTSTAFFYTDRTNARIGIGTSSPGSPLTIATAGGAGTIGGASQTQIFQVTDASASDYINLAHFNCESNVSRGSFMLSNNGTNGAWEDNVIQMFSHGSSYPYGYYGGNLSDAGCAMIVTQGSEIQKLQIGNYNAAPIEFFTDNTFRVRIDTGGNVGIGTATPYSKLQVNGSLSVAIDGSDVSTGGEGIIFGTDGSIYSNDSGPGPMLSLDQTNGLRIYGDGGTSSAVILSTDRGYARIGIGTATPDSTLHVVGDVNIDGNLTFDSFTESVVAIGNSSTSKTISLTSGTVQTCTLTGNCTFTMPTATAGKSFSLFLNTGSGGFTATFTGVRWSDSTPPTITSTASKVDLLSFISDGSYWYGSFSQNYG
jgi:hypothetical protein